MKLTARGSVTADNGWFATRTNWVHVQSMCSACSDNVHTLTAFAKDPYTGNMSGRPNIVVDSVQVKAQGNLGTTRAATIKFMAFTQSQLDELVACYGVPQMSVRVQFGWNKGATRKSAPSPITDRSLSDTQALCKMRDARESSGIYDGLQGRVGKYAVSFNKDLMAWEMTVDIVAPSAPVLSRPVEDLGTTCYCDTVATNKTTGATEKTNSGMSLFRALITDPINNHGDDVALSTGQHLVTLNHGDRDALGSSDNGIINMVMGFLNKESTKEVYMEFGALEEMVNKYSQSQAEDKPLMAKFDSSKLGRLTYKEPGYSADPDICLFPGLDKGYEGLSGTCVDNGGIDITKIWLNCIFINKCIEDIGKDGTIQDFFERIFQGINECNNRPV